MNLKNLKLSAWYGFHMIVCSFAILLMFAPFIPVVKAQDAGVRELDRRIATIESQALDHRTTAIEVALADFKEQLKDLKDELHSADLWHKCGTAGTGLLIAERGVWALRKKEEE